MTPRSLAELILLAALWGASFLFMRVAGPVALKAPVDRQPWAERAQRRWQARPMQPGSERRAGGRGAR